MGKLIWREDLDKADLSDLDTTVRLAPVPPGDVLRLDFMEPLGVSATALAKRAGVPTNCITAILHGERANTADTAPRCSHNGRNSPNHRDGEQEEVAEPLPPHAP